MPIWALIPAFFKAQYNTNETLFTLMMNYVAIQLVAYFVIRWEVPKGSGKIGIINQTTRAGWLPVLGEHDYLLNILIVLALTVFMSIYLKYSKHGYEISVVGESVNTARYIGINVKKVILRTMALSGAVCGIAGLLLVGGTDHTITNHHRRQPGLYCHYGVLAGQVQPGVYDPHLVPAGVPAKGRRRDLYRFYAGPIVLRHYYGYYPVLYYRQRVLYQL